MSFPLLKKIQKAERTLGPGLITGAADDDPSGIATYSQTGAQFGYSQLWIAVFLLPLMVAVQEASARIGAVKGKGIAAVIKDYFGKPVLYLVIFLILVANTINLGVDLGAMAASANLLLPLPSIIYILFFALIILFLEIFASYHSYAKVLKWLSLSLLAYPLTLLVVRIPWPGVIKSTLVPHFEFNLPFLFVFTGVLGTTISPYMFFWQASEEIEEVREEHLLVSGMVRMKNWFMKRLRIDNFIGMFSSQVATWCIIVVTATVLHQAGITDIRSAADAARALEPLVRNFPNSGLIAKSIFAAGVIGLGLLSIPVLSGSAAYALSEAFGWRHGLDKKLKQAPGFYAVIILATIVGIFINLLGIDPIRALVYTAVINGIIAIPLIFLIARIAESEKVMGEYRSGLLSRILVWICFFGMGLAGLSLLFVH